MLRILTQGRVSILIERDPLCILTLFLYADMK